MDTNALPTKRNLLAAKQKLTLAQKGHGLLELKLTVLIREKKCIEKSATQLREELQHLRTTAQRTRAIAETECGAETVDGLALLFSEANPVPYKLNETCAAFDEAFFALAQVLAAEKKLAELDAALTALNNRINRTKKRAAALNNIVIPTHQTRIKFITERLEEHERDEMIRLKSASRIGKQTVTHHKNANRE
ncbi:MAG: hypothetical protein FWB96_03465 [Defluviitaleaceae bacterium]|nr:hypothetical protein [Defluviitaleaceae bacterium]MCL2261738.1 hypothetical protein [Defluviitaleaceae bacterium]